MRTYLSDPRLSQIPRPPPFFRRQGLFRSLFPTVSRDSLVKSVFFDPINVYQNNIHGSNSFLVTRRRDSVSVRRRTVFSGDRLWSPLSIAPPPPPLPFCDQSKITTCGTPPCLLPPLSGEWRVRGSGHPCGSWRGVLEDWFTSRCVRDRSPSRVRLLPLGRRREVLESQVTSSVPESGPQRFGLPPLC